MRSLLNYIGIFGFVFLLSFTLTPNSLAEPGRRPDASDGSKPGRRQSARAFDAKADRNHDGAVDRREIKRAKEITGDHQEQKVDTAAGRIADTALSPPLRKMPESNFAKQGSEMMPPHVRPAGFEGAVQSPMDHQGPMAGTGVFLPPPPGDFNNDGFVDQAEKQHARKMHAHTQNGERAAPGPADAETGNAGLRADRNQDGTVDRAERHEAKKRRADRNQDGEVDRFERREAGKRMADRDRDSAVDRVERDRAGDHVTNRRRADRNHDGEVDRREQNRAREVRGGADRKLQAPGQDNRKDGANRRSDFAQGRPSGPTVQGRGQNVRREQSGPDQVRGKHDAHSRDRGGRRGGGRGVEPRYTQRGH